MKHVKHQTDEVARQIGAVIRRRRMELQISQRDLARSLGIHRSSVGHWECGDYRPTRDLARALGLILGVDLLGLDASLVRRAMAAKRTAPQSSEQGVNGLNSTGAQTGNEKPTQTFSGKPARFDDRASYVHVLGGVQESLPLLQPVQAGAASKAHDSVAAKAVAASQTQDAATHRDGSAGAAQKPLLSDTRHSVQDLLRITRMPHWGIVEQVGLDDTVETFTNRLARLVLAEKVCGLPTVKTLLIQTAGSVGEVGHSVEDLPAAMRDLASCAGVQIVTYQTARDNTREAAPNMRSEPQMPTAAALSKAPSNHAASFSISERLRALLPVNREPLERVNLSLERPRQR